MDSETRLMRLARNWVEGEVVKAEMELEQNAVGWVIVLCDITFKRFTLYGIYDSAIEAMEQAGKWSDELNAFNEEGDEGWGTMILPLQPKD